MGGGWWWWGVYAREEHLNNFVSQGSIHEIYTMCLFESGIF